MFLNLKMQILKICLLLDCILCLISFFTERENLIKTCTYYTVLSRYLRLILTSMFIYTGKSYLLLYPITNLIFISLSSNYIAHNLYKIGVPMVIKNKNIPIKKKKFAEIYCSIMDYLCHNFILILYLIGIKHILIQNKQNIIYILTRWGHIITSLLWIQIFGKKSKEYYNIDISIIIYIIILICGILSKLLVDFLL